MIPVSVIIPVRNEAARIERCLAAVAGFAEVFVVDSASSDKTVALAQSAGATVVPYVWDGCYPKKKQWCLDRLQTTYDWVLLIDADEVLTPALGDEIAALFTGRTAPPCAGYFIGGRYVWPGRVLRFGACNNKLSLFERHKFAFPEIDDLDLPGIGEVEGHYQPLLLPEYAGEKIGFLKAPLLHYAAECEAAWIKKHENYAAWERGMNARNAWPADPLRWRQALKHLFRGLPFRPAVAFLHSYFLKGGVFDGVPGFRFARARYRYYRMIVSGR